MPKTAAVCRRSFGGMLANFTTTTVVRPLTVVTMIAMGAAIASGCGEVESAGAGRPVPAQVTLGDAGSPSGVYVIDRARPAPSGAIRFVLANRGKTERGAEVVAVAPGHGLAEAFAAAIKVREGTPTPNWLRWAGGLGVIQPGHRGTFTVALRPGRYFVIDRSFQGKPATLSKLAARAALDVTRKGRPAPLAAAAASITATEYRFTARGLEAGRHTVRLENAGKQPHNFVISPLRKGKTLEDVKKYVADDSGPPPVDFERETVSGVLESGTHQDLALELTPGTYALLCFASDRAGGPPHVATGMLNEVTVP
jgi:hypothetical protein